MSVPAPSAEPIAPSPSVTGPAWTDRDLAADPHRDGQKPEKVRAMFAAIARSYDLNNRVHSLWMDQLWRRFAVKVAEPRGGEEALDCACGTGDLTMALARWRERGSSSSNTKRGARLKRVVGLDFTAEMLDIARHKLGRVSQPQAAANAQDIALISYLQGDAQQLPFADASFDILTIAFGIRNVQDPRRALAEFRRVLRPGGRLVILEFAEPRFAPVRWFNDVYCRRVMPVTATWISKDTSGAYKYLPKSVQTFTPPEELKSWMIAAGFAGPRDWGLSLGICRCYRAYVPTARRT